MGRPEIVLGSHDGLDDSARIVQANDSRPNRRSAYRKLAVVTLCLAAIYNGLPFILPRTTPNGQTIESSLCTTPACVHAASEILYNLSPNYKDLDPCTDFEELVFSWFLELIKRKVF